MRLTQFSHGAGCGCKLSPLVLGEILKEKGAFRQQNLLVGYEGSDDAAVLDLTSDELLLATTDFFTPIVDSPRLFGKIAATNALSDIFAMGGRPILALALLGWPIDHLGPELAREVLAGAREVLESLGLELAGGHSIDCREPIFGLAVNGVVPRQNLKRNYPAQVGDILYLTKPLGTGILTTAEKRGILKEEHREKAIMSMTTLNNLGQLFGEIKEVHAMTDVTGFGLAGHLLEMLRNSHKKAVLYFEKLAFLPGVDEYLAQNAVPGGTHRNWKSYGEYVQFRQEDNREYLKIADPQTSGGLLVAVAPTACERVEEIISRSAFSFCAQPIGEIIAGEPKILIQ
ncbi:MAG: selenide, water dikinase SelD [Leptospiraceae bacterium]|nr:selenide, water dikinase SelD [Leptospiraceae bacterium]MDW8306730.1 selenide, water dikinase SelD [Leptospiraceae bacterium]